MNEETAVNLYENFHGYLADEDFHIELENMNELTYLGKAIAIEYEAKKHDDKKFNVYRHDFGEKAILLTNGKDLIVFNPEMKIEERGIVG